MSESTITLEIDGREVTVDKGTNVIEAAKLAGFDVPAFCYHPGLSIAACCRQCLVEVEGNPKLQPSCQMAAADGMKVMTASDRAVLARKQMLEFTLVNHPVDCPICDKAGECLLQRHYFDHDTAQSRVDVPKVRKPKVKDLGPHIVLDAERCILCTRCIRVCDEVAGEHQLEMKNRGNKEEIDTAPGAVLDNPYSINTVDVCPVGALTSKDFRFTMRAWELMMTPSVCTGCATGCEVEVQHKNDRVWRLQPRQDGGSDGNYWMCDEGRLSYHRLREKRLAAAFIEGLPSTWDRALSKAALLLGGAMGDGRGRIGVVFSPQHSNEDNFVLAKLAREIWQFERCYIGGRPAVPGRADDILRDADVNPNTRGVQMILGEALKSSKALEADILSGDLRALIVLGHELNLSKEALTVAREMDAVIAFAEGERRTALGCTRCGQPLTVEHEATEADCEHCKFRNEVPAGYDSRASIAAQADVVFPIASWAEVRGTIVNRDGRIRRLHPIISAPGQARPAWQSLVALGQATGAAIAFDNPRAVYNELAKFFDLDADSWGRPVMPVQLRFAGSRG